MLGGYLIAYLNLDKVIKIIRNEDEPKPVLIKAFKLTEVQAEAILNMRLRSLRKLEEMEIRREDKDLRDEEGHQGAARLRRRSNGTRSASRSARCARLSARRRRSASAARPSPMRPSTISRSDRGGVGRARADHGRDLRQGLDPRAEGPCRRPLGPRLQDRRRADDRLLRRDHVEMLVLFATNGNSTRSTSRSCRAGAAMASRSACSSTSSRTPTIVVAVRHQGGRKFLIASSEGQGFVVAGGRVRRPIPARASRC